MAPQDRPDLIQSELSGLAFEALQQAFRKQDVDAMMEMDPPPPGMYENIHIFVDPAAGGPSSDYGILSVTLWRGMVTVRAFCFFLPFSLFTHVFFLSSPGTLPSPSPPDPMGKGPRSKARCSPGP